MIIIANLLEQDIKKSYEEQGYFGRRLRDMTMKFGSSSPFDFLMFNGKILMGLEAKLLSSRKSGNPKSFSFSRLSSTQREGLENLNTYDNTLPIILINFRWCNHKKGECYALTYNEFIDYENNLGRKSIPLDLFREEITSIEREGSGWNLTQIFNKFERS